jgi:hypothetical protein
MRWTGSWHTRSRRRLHGRCSTRPEPSSRGGAHTTPSLRAGGEIYGGASSGAVFVVTHDPPDEPDPKVAFKTSVRDAVEAGIDAAAGKNVVVTGGEISRRALDMGLVDEIQVHVAPALLGNGIRLFDTLRTRPFTLETRNVAAGELIDMRFRVVK